MGFVATMIRTRLDGKIMRSSTTRAAGVAASSRTVTGPMIRSIDAVVAAATTSIGDVTELQTVPPQSRAQPACPPG